MQLVLQPCRVHGRQARSRAEHAQQSHFVHKLRFQAASRKLVALSSKLTQLVSDHVLQNHILTVECNRMGRAQNPLQVAVSDAVASCCT